MEFAAGPGSERPVPGVDVVIDALPLTVLVADGGEDGTAPFWDRLIADPAFGYRLETVRTGAEALARCREDPPACLLLGERLPDMRASDVLEALPCDHGLTAFPIILIVDRVDETTDADVGGSIVEACVARNELGEAVLRVVVHGAVERHRLRRELAETRGQLADPTAHRDAAVLDAAARWRSDVLAEAGRRLGESLDPAATLAAVTEVLVPAVADLCVVDLLHDDGSVERAAVIHADPARADLAAGLRPYPPDMSRPGVADAMRTGCSECYLDVTDEMLTQFARDDDHLALLRQLGIVSHMRVPLVARGRVLGSLLLVSTDPTRRYGPEDQATAEELAGRCALALDNARLHAAEERARRRATALADATRALTEVSATPAAVLPLVARQAATLVGDLAVVRLLSPDGRWLEPVAVDHPDEAARHEARAAVASERHPADHGANGAALRTGRPQRVAGESLTSLRESSDPHLWPPMPSTPTDALLAVCLREEGHGIGTLSVSRSSTGRSYDGDDERFLQELADRAALAIERARLFSGIQASEERFRRIFEHAATGIAIIDLDGRFVQCNPAYAAMLGYDDGQLHGQPVAMIVHPDDRAATLAELEHLQRGELSFFETESRCLHLSGEPVWVRTFVSLLPDGSGAPTHLVALVTDVTERRRAEAERAALLAQEQAARADAEGAVRARDQFLSIAAHELRTPTAGIKGHAQLALRTLRRGTYESDRLERNLLGIEISANRLTALIDDLLDVARLQSGQLRLRPAALDLAALVEAAVRRHGEHAGGSLELVYEETGGPVPVIGDAGRLDQVVDNLLSNALKYSPGGGEVRVSLRADEHEAVITVRDGGIGLPTGAAEQIFRPFGRAANATSQNLPGMGLGLYISRQIVGAHGGRISAASAGEGRGTTFTVCLPASAALATDGAVPSAGLMAALVVEQTGA